MLPILLLCVLIVVVQKLNVMTGAGQYSYESPERDNSKDRSEQEIAYALKVLYMIHKVHQFWKGADRIIVFFNILFEE